MMDEVAQESGREAATPSPSAATALVAAAAAASQPPQQEVKKSFEQRLLEQKAERLEAKRKEFRQNRPSVTLSFTGLSYIVDNGKKVVLNNLNGVFKAGQLIALMGPSGAGKSTLLNVLAGYRTRQSSGRILVNGVDRNLPLFRKMSCYVMQDDVLMKNLSVKEYLLVSAELRLPKDLTTDERLVIVRETMASLRLTSCADVAAGSLSGGQRKRLAVALELINDPPIIFLDEPTSGLDSTTALDVTKLLRELADSGRTVVCTIHQPSATLFEMFDMAYVLSTGQTIFAGSTKDIVPYFRTLNIECPKYHNPADFLLEIASGLKGDVSGIVKSWSDRKEFANELPTDTVGRQITFLDRGQYVTGTTLQFVTLARRAARELLRDKLMTKLRIIAHINGGLLFGLLYLNQGTETGHVHNILGYLFFSLLFLMLATVMPTVLTFPVEKEVFIREHMNNWYRIKAYYYAKSVVDLPLQFILPTIYLIITYFMLDLPHDGTRFFKLWLIMVLHTQVAQSFAVMIGAAAPTLEIAVFLAPMAAIPFILFCGFFVVLDQIKPFLRWIQYLSYFRYSFTGLVVGLFKGLPLECDIRDVDGNCIPAPGNLSFVYANGDAVISFFGLDYSFDEYGYQVLILCVYWVFFKFAAYFILRFKGKRAY